MLDDERCRAADHRRGHAGSAQPEIGLVERRLATCRLIAILKSPHRHVWILNIERASRSPQRNHAVARSNQVRFCNMVKERRPFGAKAGSFGEETAAYAAGIIGPHCYYERIICGRRDRSVTLCAIAVVAPRVACRNNYNDSGSPRRFHCLTKRIERVGLIDLASQR